MMEEIFPPTYKMDSEAKFKHLALINLSFQLTGSKQIIQNTENLMPQRLPWLSLNQIQKSFLKKEDLSRKSHGLQKSETTIDYLNFISGSQSIHFWPPKYSLIQNESAPTGDIKKDAPKRRYSLVLRAVT